MKICDVSHNLSGESLGQLTDSAVVGSKFLPRVVEVHFKIMLGYFIEVRCVLFDPWALWASTI